MWCTTNVTVDIKTAICKPIILEERIVSFVLWNGDLQEHVRENKTKQQQPRRRQLQI